MSGTETTSLSRSARETVCCPFEDAMAVQSLLLRRGP